MTHPTIKPMISAPNISPGLKSPAQPSHAEQRSSPMEFANTYVVTNTNDTGAGSFRRAIEDANQHIGSDLISFNISGAALIQPLTALPIIQDAVVIDGTTQPNYTGSPVVRLDGSLAGKDVDGLRIWANNCTVRGLDISGFIGSHVVNSDSEIMNGSGIDIVGGNNNLIEGNYIGLDLTGTVAQGNDFGVSIFGNSTGNVIGGLTTAAQNRISGNNYSGIYISQDNTGGNTIEGNLIGAIYPGGTYTDSVGNRQAGVYIRGPNDTVGGTTAGARNIISGNKIVGIALDSLATGNVIYGNYIGTDVQGKYALGNLGDGVWVDSIGGNFIAGNIISGNDGAGVYLENIRPNGNRVVGNYIGTNAACTSLLPNSFGVVIDSAYNNTIGGLLPGQCNVISGNTGYGIAIVNSADANIIQGNIIGTDPTGYYTWGNGYDGIIIAGSQNIIGGSSVDAGNLIWYNKGAGIYDTAGNGNLIRMNSIYSNGDLGIDLAPPGVNLNTTPGTPGPNNLQNYPVLDSITFGATYDTIYGSLNSQANQSYIIDFYSSGKGNPTGYGEGKDWIDSLHVQTGSDGTVSFVKVLSPVNVGHELSATATDQTGNTSEFSLDLTGVSITILKPLKDSLFVAGKTDTIRWRAPQVDSVDILYTTQADKTPIQYTSLVTNYPAQTGQYIWDPVPANILSRKCRILIRSSKNQEISDSSDLFRIKPYVLTRIGSDGNYIVFSPGVDGWRFANDTEFMWPQQWWQHFDYNWIDPNTGMLYPAFFSTFPYSAVSSDFPDWPLWVDAFTRDQCFYPNPHTGSFNYNEWALEKWGSTTGFWGGSCYGLATTCFLCFDGYMKPPDNAPSLFQYFGPDDDVRKLINKYYIYQFGWVQQSHCDVAYRQPLEQTLNDLITMFNSDIRNDRVLSLYSPGGAHSVNPYRFGEGSTVDSIFIYDNNYPGEQRYITVDKMSPRTWHYTIGPGEEWGGAGGVLLLEDPISDALMFPLLMPPTGASLATTKSVQATTAHFKKTQETTAPAIMVYNSSNASVRITNAAGDSMGYNLNSGKWFSSMSSGHPIIPETGTKHPPVGYYLPLNVPTATYSVTMMGFTDSLVHFAIFTDSAMYSYHRSDGDSTQTDNVSFSDGLRFSNKDPQTKKLLLKAIVHTADAEHCFKISNYSAGQNDSLYLRMDKQTELVLRNFGSPKVYDMDIIHNTSNGGKKYTHKNIAMDANTSQRIIPAWNGLDTQSVKILIDHGNKGSYDDSTLFSINSQPTVLGQTPYLDLTFGNQGMIQAFIFPGDFEDWASAVAIQADGKILVGGTSYRSTGNDYTFAVVRFNKNGMLDTTFGTKGIGRTNVNGGDSLDWAYAMAIQPDGKIVLVGQSGTNETDITTFALARFDTIGNIDNTFGNNGTVKTTLRGRGISVAIQHDGKIVVAGITGTSTINDHYHDTVVVARFKQDGSLDGTFGLNGGILKTPIYGSVWVSSLAIQPDGRIIVAGSKSDRNGTNIASIIARYDTNGTPDATFGPADGIVSFTGNGNLYANSGSVLIQSDGKIVVAGSNPSIGGFGVTRLNPDGTVDSSFGALGSNNIDISRAIIGEDAGNYAVLQSDDKIVDVGWTVDSLSRQCFAVVRFKVNGFIDTTFGINGSVVTSMGDASTLSGGQGAAIQSDAKIVVVGGNYITLIRYMPQSSFIVEGVRKPSSSIPSEWNLNQNYPNPFNPATTIRYQLLKESKVHLVVYNLLGQVVATLVDGIEQAGTKQVVWNARNIASGVYFYRLEAKSIGDPGKTFTNVKKMVLIK